jgi:CCR4-NOT transcription complex subunit 1
LLSSEQGTLRVLLVLLHDFPEFLCDYYYTFCDVIPPNCIQMRNLILSTFPRNMRLPDPFTPNLKVDLLPEISHTPRIVTNITPQIQAAFKKVRSHVL